MRPTVIFDLDGTLVDSLEHLRGALNATLQEYGRPALDRAAVAPMIGDGARVLLRRALAATGGLPDEAGEDFAALHARFLAIYQATAADTTQPYPGVPEGLAALAAAGYALAICTNKPQVVTEKMLGALGLAPHFAAVYGGDRLAVSKPDPAPLLAALRDVGGDARRAAMVGDHANDLAAGRAAGVATILARYGYGEASTAGLTPHATIDTFAELPAVLARVLRVAQTSA
ncbi:MAG: phosphoglycolate phosphatase [Hyphomicrobiales bacterium]|nr:phosphoglycolate phosphatase [Hyphomicrobiales bacterium]